MLMVRYGKFFDMVFVLLSKKEMEYEVCLLGVVLAISSGKKIYLMSLDEDIYKAYISV